MAANHLDYLAGQVLSEGQIVSYRNLSRALKVHANAAKRMLFDFYRRQNGKKPKSVHATYLICGARIVPELETDGVHTRLDDDVDMQDSMPSSSMPGPDSSLPPSSVANHEVEQPSEDVLTTSIMIAREENLDIIKKHYLRIDGIHIYSLEPGPLEHMQLLSDCTRRVLETQIHEDPLDSWKQYGTIHNSRAKRRTGARPPLPAPTPAVPVTAGMKAAARPVAGASNTAGPASKKNTKSRPSTSDNDSSTGEKMTNPSSLKRESSSLFKSFAKSKAPEKKPGISQEKDEDMADASEEEERELVAVPEMSNEAKSKAESDRKAKAERERTLKSMMEDDHEEGSKVDGEEHEDEDEEMQDPDAEARAAAVLKSQPEVPMEETAQVSACGGRRRGRRRTMKKKHFKDAEGYMVTKEEPVWESFSEDEAEPSAAKKLALSSNSAKTMGNDERAKKAGKPGQGNIMSFFGRKA